MIFNNQSANERKKVKFPLYVLMFILVGILFTLNTIYNIVPTQINLFSINIDMIFILKKLSSFFILMAMVAMGLKIDFKSFKSKGLKALYIGSILFITLSIISYGLVQFT